MAVTGRRHSRLGIWLFFVGLYALSGGGRFFSTDEVGAFQLTRYWMGGDPVAASNVTTLGYDGLQWNWQGPLISVFAVPLYAAGELLEELPPSWQLPLAGPFVGDAAGVQWGGDLHIFSVSLFNSFVTSTLLVLYLGLCMRLGAGQRAALLATLALGTTTLLYAHSKNFFTHALTATLLLGSLSALIRARGAPEQRWRVAAGLLSGAMFLTRPASAVAIPWLALHTARHSGNRPRERLPALLAYSCPVALAIAISLFYNWYRFGDPLVFYPTSAPFSRDVLTALYGHLLSVGRSIFLYSPALVLALAFARPFGRSHPVEFQVISGASASLLALYSLHSVWDGSWCWGNRFLLPLVPLLALPLPLAFEALLRRPRHAAVAAVALLLLAGLAIQVLGLAVNVSFVYHDYGFASDEARNYLFHPAQSQFAAHLDALLRGRFLDSWLYRAIFDAGPAAATLLALPWIACLATGSWIVGIELRRAETSLADADASNSSLGP